MEKGECCEDIPDTITLFPFFSISVFGGTVTSRNLLLRDSGQQQQENSSGFPPVLLASAPFYPEISAAYQVCVCR